MVNSVLERENLTLQSHCVKRIKISDHEPYPFEDWCFEGEGLDYN